MYRALIEAFDRLADDDALSCMVLHGQGGSFSAGNDLDGFMAAGSTDGAPPSLTLMHRAVEAEKPVIAAVEGWAVGIGATLLVLCDLVYMGRSARLKMPFTELGIVPEAGASRLVTRRYGRQVAGELLLLSDPMSAERAAAVGLCNEVTEDGEALLRAMRAAERLASLSQTSVRLTKRLMAEPDDLKAHIDEEMRLVGERVRSDEMQARVTALMGRKG